MFTLGHSNVANNAHNRKWNSTNRVEFYFGETRLSLEHTIMVHLLCISCLIYAILHSCIVINALLSFEQFIAGQILIVYWLRDGKINI